MLKILLVLFLLLAQLSVNAAPLASYPVSTVQRATHQADEHTLKKRLNFEFFTSFISKAKSIAGMSTKSKPTEFVDGSKGFTKVRKTSAERDASFLERNKERKAATELKNSQRADASNLAAKNRETARIEKDFAYKQRAANRQEQRKLVKAQEAKDRAVIQASKAKTRAEANALKSKEIAEARQIKNANAKDAMELKTSLAKAKKEAELKAQLESSQAVLGNARNVNTRLLADSRKFE